MIVCVCRRVSDHQIRQAVAEGAHSLECLQIELGVATQCGRCAECACQVMRDAQAKLAAGAHGGSTAQAPLVRLQPQPA